MLGLELISITQGLKYLSIIKSYPNNSKEFFLSLTKLAQAFNVKKTIYFIYA